MLSSPTSQTVTQDKNESRPIVQLRNVSRIYQDAHVAAVDNVSLDIAFNEFVAITGPSGCGKSTLLHLIAGLDVPTIGEIFVDDVALHSANDFERTAYRRRKIGVVFQFFNLLPTMNVIENVTLPLLLDGRSEANARAEELLELVGLNERAHHFPHQLSGGELQRAAIARAMIHQPRILLADEPTGNLDSSAAAQVLRLFEDLSARNLTTLIVVTHSEQVARCANRRIPMRDGKLVST
jgi:ABC-type lipoprotein export system ATPase subunit